MKTFGDLRALIQSADAQAIRALPLGHPVRLRYEKLLIKLAERVGADLGASSLDDAQQISSVIMNQPLQEELSSTADRLLADICRLVEGGPDQKMDQARQPRRRVLN